ncbi:insulin-like growth factor 2 mRNA-binding protein 1 isoform X1 [Argiope bruennichi]|uniref:insulin-like growth factor 2 mRNA-binding protein 1 isoform X1 n=2 Tax=Argiope bruennichi TaxID=94029 RepID=UPI0024958066|nr:insulin-like growth factor 2 mRNA-binding protein 1 isoform X1 [Argiope bruennichi]
MSVNRQLYITNLPSGTNEEMLHNIFCQQTGVSPQNITLRYNYALVDLPDNLHPERAIEVLNGYEVMGSQLLVEPSLNQNRRNRGSVIQINNIPDHYPWDEFTRFLSNFGNFQHCEKGASKQNVYNAVATYETQAEAQQALLQLNNYEIQPGSFLKVEHIMELGRGRGGRGSRTGPPRPFSSPGLYRSNDFPLRILVLSDMVGAIIGRAGGTIRQITQQSRARVDVHRKENAGSPEKVITIYGSPENCSAACQKIMEIMQQEANATNRGELPLKILAHNSLIGRIIGKNGSTIKRIMEQSDTKIAVSSNIHDFSSWNLERIITVKGKLENLSKAEKMISAKLRQSYENDLAAVASQTYMYPGMHPMALQPSLPSPTPSPPYGMYGVPPPPVDLNKETVYIYIPSSAVGAIIGTGGSNIREMISCSGASIKVIQPQQQPQQQQQQQGMKDPADKLAERKVCVIGTPESQWKAQFMIFKKVGFEGFRGPQDATLKVEIFVPTNQVGRIIGKGGSTVRELQRMTHALIKFPENGQNTETDETAVHIVGDFFCAMAAQRQIRSLAFKSNGFLQQQQRRRLSQPLVQN